MPVNTALRDFLLTRRSVGVAFLRDPGPDEETLRQILTIGVRVPDHGKLAPWRLVVVQGEDRIRVGEKLAELAKKNNPQIDEASLEVERKRFLPAPVTIGVLLSPKKSDIAPEWEQLLSAGNVCHNLLNAAYAFGFAGTWVSRWYSINIEAQQMLGARGGERFVGWVHIGTPAMVPEDRERPALDSVVSRWQG